MTINPPWLLKSRNRNNVKDSEWSFSCRTTPHNAYSDSDSDRENENSGSMVSEESRLLNQFDLSTREETVQYKPNPFSIAKINAASRGLPTKGNGSNKSPSRVLRPSGKSAAATIGRNKDKKGERKSRPNASIIDGFKKQSQKAALASNLKKAVPATSSCSTVPSKPVSKSSNLKPFNSHPTSHAKVSSPPHADETNSVTLRDLQETSLATHITTPDGPICVQPLSLFSDPPQNAHITSFVDGFANTLARISPAAIIEDASTQNLADVELDMLTGASPQNPDFNATLIDIETSVSNALVLAQSPRFSPPFPPSQGCDLDPCPSNSPGPLAVESTLNPNNLKFTMPNAPRTRPRLLSLSSPPQERYTRTPGLDSFTASNRFDASAMSSPLRPADHLASHDMSRMPVTHVATNTSLAAPFSFHPLGRCVQNPHGPLTIRRSLVHFTDDDHLEGSAPLQADRPPFSRYSTPLHRITAYKTNTGDNGTDDLGYRVKSEDTTPHPEDTSLHVSRGPITPTEPAGILPLAPDSIVYYHDVDHKRPHSPSPEPRTTNVRSRPVKDAYDFLSSDPDENWSTLPVRKKVKTRTPTPVIRTRKFRLPKLNVGNSNTTATAKIEKTGMDATSARRVITFLPPPLKPASENKVVNSQVAYPSPSYSALKSSSSPAHEKPFCLRTQDQSPVAKTSFKVYKPLSPPSSDSPCLASPDRSRFHGPIEIVQDGEGQDDVHTPINLPSIARLYPGMKAAWREVGQLFCLAFSSLTSNSLLTIYYFPRVSRSAGGGLKRRGTLWNSQVADVYIVTTHQMSRLKAKDSRRLELLSSGEVDVI
ncbi:hypothetical protein C0995_004062 [Termitomyces sp. Mi166|nr:hypothetical protein C0995_004062 [Termitomyces sp. Mi166\